MKLQRGSFARATEGPLRHGSLSLGALALSVVVTTSACSGEPKRDPSQFPISGQELARGAAAATATTATPAEADDAAELTYRRYCIGCHGDDGHGNEGTTGADLAAVDGPLAKRSDAELLASVRDGKVGRLATMPAHKPILSEAQITSVVAYVRRQFGPDGAR